MTQTVRFSVWILLIALIIGGIFYYYQNQPSADVLEAKVNLSEIIQADFADQGKLTIDVSKLNSNLDSNTRPVVNVVKEKNDKTYFAGSLFKNSGGSSGSETLGFYISRLMADGSVDTSYDGGLSFHKLDYDGTLAYLRVADLAILDDDSVLVLVSYSIKPNYTSHERILKLLPNGKIDPEFGLAGQGTARAQGKPMEWEKLLVQADNKIVVAGNIRQELTLDSGNKIDSHGIFLTRFLANGQLDLKFGDGTYASGTTVTQGLDKYQNYLGSPYDGIMGFWDEEGKIIIAYGSGESGQYSYAPFYGNSFSIARYTASGALETMTQTIFDGITEKPEGFNYNPYDDNVWIIGLVRSGEEILLFTESIDYDNSDAWVDNVFSFNQDGQLNQEFGNKGIIQVSIAGSTRISYTDGVVLNNNTLIGYGSSDDLNQGTLLTELYRINLDSKTLDTSFGQNGILTVDNQIYYDRNAKIFNNLEPNTWWTLDNDTFYSRYFGSGSSELLIHKVDFTKLNNLNFTQEQETKPSDDTTTPSDQDTSQDTSADTTVVSNLPTTDANKYCTANRSLPSTDFDGNGQTDTLAYNPTDGHSRIDHYFGDVAPINKMDSNWELGFCHYAKDFNGDQYADLLSYRPTDGQTAMMSSSKGVLSTAWRQEFPKNRFFAVGDFTSDKRGDVITYNPDTGEVDLRAGQQDATLKTIWEDNWGKDWLIFAGDFDGDRLSDTFLYNATSGTARFLTYTETNNKPKTVFETNWSTGWTLYPGDYNGDGHTDFLAYNATNGRANLSLFGNISKNPGDIKHAPTEYWQKRDSGEATWSLGWDFIMGDYDGTSTTDFISYNPTTGDARIELFKKDDPGSFTDHLATSWSSGWRFNR